jgi:hypothetical protein
LLARAVHLGLPRAHDGGNLPGSSTFSRLIVTSAGRRLRVTVIGMSMSMSTNRVVLIWLLLAVCMIGNGIIREVALVRVFGRDFSELASVVLGIAIVLAVTSQFFRSTRAMEMGELFRVSILWLVMTVAFEFSFGHYVDHKTWSELAANYAIWRGRLFILVLVALGLAPFLWNRWLPLSAEHRVG